MALHKDSWTSRVIKAQFPCANILSYINSPTRCSMFVIDVDHSSSPLLHSLQRKLSSQQIYPIYCANKLPTFLNVSNFVLPCKREKLYDLISISNQRTKTRFLLRSQIFSEKLFSLVKRWVKTSSSLLSRVQNIIKIVNSRLASDLTHFYSRSSKLNTLFLLLQNLFYYFFFDKNNKRVQATWGSHARLKILLKKLSKWRRLVDCSCRWFRSVETSSFGENSPHAGSKSGKSSFAENWKKNSLMMLLFDFIPLSHCPARRLLKRSFHVWWKFMIKC